MRQFMRLLLIPVVCIVAMFFIGFPQSYAAGDAVATGTRVGGNETRTRFVADISKTVNFSVYVLPDPYRVVIDLPDVTFDLPPGIGHKVRGLVSQYRYGLVEAGKSRIVIDTHGPVLIEKSFLVEPQTGQPARLVVDLVKTTEQAFVKSYNAEQAKIQKDMAALSVPPADTAVPEKKKILGIKRGKKTIVLDPGHGGIDPGAISRAGTKEKDVVLSFANVLRQALL
ncbi:MAG: AMIN domain-containing protein, partial [Hyphomicrobiales bacterium]|nr:AMIN domain-containing protein [Hyphomicrobiales bacterium]